MRRQRPNIFSASQGTVNNSFAKGKGRMFGKWVDDNSRSNGYDENDLIQNPAYIIESIIRDEILVVRDMVLQFTSTGLGKDVIECADLPSMPNDFYNGAEFFNVTTGHKGYVYDYTQSGNVMTIDAADGSIADDDKFFLTNVDGENKIDYASFDVVGNSSSGKRNGWIFAKSIYQKENADSIISRLLFESRCIMIETAGKYKLIALDEETGSVDTWTSPLKSNGKYMVGCGLTPLSVLFNDFKVNYAYDYGKGEYQKSLFVNKSGFTSTLTNGSSYQATCKSIYENYSKLINKYECNCDWIYDDDTAELFFNHLFEWHCKQRLIVNWAGGLKDYIKYDVGDQVKLNFDTMIPSGLNNSSKFMIMENPCQIIPGLPVINFKLIEMG